MSAGEGRALIGLGLVSRHQGDYAAAQPHFEQASPILREIREPVLEVWALLGLGCVSRDQGDYAAAKLSSERARRRIREIGSRWIESFALSGLGLLFHHMGDDSAAREHCQRAALIAQEIGACPFHAFALTNLGHALAGLEHLEGAAGAYRNAPGLRWEMDLAHLATESLAGLARVGMA